MSTDLIWLLVVTGLLMAASFLMGLIVGMVRTWEDAYRLGLADSDARWKRAFEAVPHCRSAPLDRTGKL